MVPSKSDLKPGDLIEISRGLYEHWAVYVGDGFVVHLASTLADVPGAFARSLKSVPNEKALVKKEKLTDVVGNDKWEINNSMDKKNKPRPAKDIVRDACARVGETLHYDVIEHNCEHFANELRYRKSKSKQVLAVATVAIALVSSGLVAPVAVLGATLLGIGFVLSRKNQ